MKLPKRTLAALAGATLPIAIAGAAPPANDDFASREVLAPDLPLLVPSSTVDATAEPDFDPSSYQSRYLSTVWYEWTAASDGLYALRGRLANEDYNSWRLSVTTADDGGELTTIAAGLSYSTTTNETVYFRAGAGQSVQFVLGSLQPGEFELSLRKAAPSAAGVVDLGAAVPQTIARSRGYAGHDLAWLWRAPADGMYVLDYYESFLRTGIVAEFFIQDAASGELPEPLFAQYWAELPSGTGYHYFRARAGRQYRINAAGEEVEFLLKRLPDAPHANLGLAVDLGMVDSFVVRGHNAQAGPLPWPEGTDVGPWEVAYSLGAQWWQWRAPAAGNYRIRSGPSRHVRPDAFWYPPQVWVFTGNSGATLKAEVTSPSWGSIGQGDSREVSYLIHADCAGELFRIGLINVIVGTGPYQAGEWEIALEAKEGAPNDDFANAIGIVTDAAPTTFTAHFATLQAGEPAPAALGRERPRWDTEPRADVGSIWWRWAADDNTPIEIQCWGGSVDVYTGAGLADLRRVPFLAKAERAEHVAVQPAAGESYFIQIGGSLTRGEIAVLRRPEFTTPPANDDWAAAEEVVFAGAQRAFSLPISCAAASAEGDEPPHRLLPEVLPAQRSRWWEWTCDQDGAQVFFTYDLGAVSVYRGDSLATLHREVNWGSSDPSKFVLRGVLGETYYIAVDDDLESLEAGGFTMVVREPARPRNDEFRHSVALVRREAIVGQSTQDILHNSPLVRARVDDPDEPIPSQEGARQTTWFHWLCDTDQPVAIDLHSPRLANGLQMFGIDVYEGDRLVSLRSVPVTQRATPDRATWTILTGTPGTFYRIAVTSLPVATSATIDIGLAHESILAREAWLARYPELGFADTAEHASPAGDGIANLVKRAFGLNPTIHAHSGQDPRAHHLPMLEHLADGRIRLVFTRDPGDPSLVIKGQVSHSGGAGWYQRIDPVPLEDGREAVYMPHDERQKLMRLIVSVGG